MKNIYFRSIAKTLTAFVILFAVFCGSDSGNQRGENADNSAKRTSGAEKICIAIPHFVNKAGVEEYDWTTFAFAVILNDYFRNTGLFETIEIPALLRLENSVRDLPEDQMRFFYAENLSQYHVDYLFFGKLVRSNQGVKAVYSLYKVDGKQEILSDGRLFGSKDFLSAAQGIIADLVNTFKEMDVTLPPNSRYHFPSENVVALKIFVDGMHNYFNYKFENAYYRFKKAYEIDAHFYLALLKRLETGFILDNESILNSGNSLSINSITLKNRNEFEILTAVKTVASGDSTGYEILDRLISENPFERDLYTIKSMLLTEEGDYDEADSVLTGYEKSDRNSSLIKYLKGKIYFRSGEYPKGVSELYDALNLYSNFALAYVDLGIVEFENNSLSRALTFFNTALKIDPDSRKAKYYLGLGYEKRGDLNLAYKTVSGIHSGEQYYVEAQILRAMIKYRQKMIPEALERLEQLAGYYPDKPEIKVSLAELYAREQETETAQTWLKSAIQSGYTDTLKIVNNPVFSSIPKDSLLSYFSPVEGDSTITDSLQPNSSLN